MNHSLWFTFTLVLLQSTFCSREADVFISVSVGQDCELTCSGREGVTVLVLEWLELERDRLLLVVSEGKVQDGREHSVYTNRVQLLDPQLQSGDLSVLLKNVTLKDSGKYECWAQYEDKQKIPQFIRLTVTEREPDTKTPTMENKPTEDMGTAGVIAIVIGLIVLSLLIGFILYRKRSQRSQVPSRESDLEKSITSSSGSNTSSKTSANFSNGHKASNQSLTSSNSQGDPLPLERTAPPPSPSMSCHLHAVEGVVSSSPGTQTTVWSQDPDEEQLAPLGPVWDSPGSDSLPPAQLPPLHNSLSVASEELSR